PGLSVGDALDFVAFDLEACAETQRQSLIVLYDYDRALVLCVASAGGLPGPGHVISPLRAPSISSVKRVPPAGASASRTCAPIAVARSRTMARPRPAPPVLS